MLELFFPSAVRVHALEKKVEDCKDIEKKHSCEVDEIYYNHGVLVRKLETSIHELRTESEIAKGRLETEYQLKGEDLEAKYQNYREEFRAKTREEYAGIVDSLKADVSKANDHANFVSGENQELRKSSELMATQIDAYKELINTLIAKLPNVDLSKFNVNVDIAPAEVTVQGGSQVKNK